MDYKAWWSGILRKKKVSPEDSTILLDLLNKSSRYDFIPRRYGDKVRFYVANYKLANGKTIASIHADLGNGTRLPISKSKVFPRAKPSPFRILCAACRNDIEYQIAHFRSTVELPVICPLSGRMLTNWKDIHIDHWIPFVDLVREWLESIGKKPEEIALQGRGSNKEIKNLDQKISWLRYHELYGELLATYSRANQSKGSKHYTRNRS